MGFEIERIEERTLRVAGEIDECACAAFEQEVRWLVRHRGEVTLEMSGVTFIDSSALQCLLSSARSLAGQGMVLIDRPSPYVLRILEISGFLEPPVGLVIHVPRVSATDGPGAVSAFAAAVDRAVGAVATSTLIVRRSVNLVGRARELRDVSVARRLAVAAAT